MKPPNPKTLREEEFDRAMTIRMILNEKSAQGAIGSQYSCSEQEILDRSASLQAILDRTKE